jgi:hypothetical protein
MFEAKSEPPSWNRVCAAGIGKKKQNDSVRATLHGSSTGRKSFRFNYSR